MRKGWSPRGCLLTYDLCIGKVRQGNVGTAKSEGTKQKMHGMELAIQGASKGKGEPKVWEKG
jgi:hypothetical protein